VSCWRDGCRKAEKKVNEEQRMITEQALTKNQELGKVWLLKALEGQRELHHARQKFEDKVNEAKRQREAAYNRHSELIVQFVKARFEYLYASKKREILQTVEAKLKEHMHTMDDFFHARQEINTTLNGRLEALESRVTQADDLSPISPISPGTMSSVNSDHNLAAAKTSDCLAKVTHMLFQSPLISDPFD
jgi:hypothetical protein